MDCVSFAAHKRLLALFAMAKLVSGARGAVWRYTAQPIGAETALIGQRRGGNRWLFHASAGGRPEGFGVYLASVPATFSDQYFS